MAQPTDIKQEFEDWKASRFRDVAVPPWKTARPELLTALTAVLLSPLWGILH